MSRTIDLLGKDLKFPLQVDANGNLATVSGLENLRQAVMDILEDFQEEVLYHEDMGVGLPGDLHRKGNQTVATKIAYRLKEQILQHEARIVEVDATGSVDPENDAIILLDVTYTDITYHHEDNLVYPLRLNP